MRARIGRVEDQALREGLLARGKREVPVAQCGARGVETPPGPGAENVALKEEARPPVQEETAAQGLRDYHRPQYRKIDTNMRRCNGRPVPAQGPRGPCKRPNLPAQRRMGFEIN